MALRLPRAVGLVKSAALTATSSESSELLTDDDVEILRAELARQLPDDIAQRVGDVFYAFTESASDEKATEGAVCVHLYFNHFYHVSCTGHLFFFQIDALRLLILGAIAEQNSDVASIVINLNECDDETTTTPSLQ